MSARAAGDDSLDLCLPGPRRSEFFRCLLEIVKEGLPPGRLSSGAGAMLHRAARVLLGTAGGPAISATRYLKRAGGTRWWAIDRVGERHPRKFTRDPWWASSPLHTGLGSMLAVNCFQSRVLSLAKNSSIFLLAKWVDEGPALSYLAQSCPMVKYDLCA
jgi:hypothetical protein